MKLELKKVIKGSEIVHFANNDTLVTSKYNTVFIKKGHEEYKIKLPSDGWKSIFGLFRLTRRALRLDKCNVFYNEGNLVIIRQGTVYHYDKNSKKLSPTLTLKNCRNVLHQSISITPNGNMFFGEYGANTERKTVPVYKSTDGGRNWKIIYEFEEKEIKHIHGCYWDNIEQKIWVCTGDFENENWLIVADENFENIEKIGNGQQVYRTCNLIFEKDEVHWLMDSQLEPSHHVILNRKSREIEVKQECKGPIWYIKRLSDGYFLAGTTQEIGDGVLDNKAHLMISKDLKSWEDLHLFDHDGLPMRYFKFGVLGFADGDQDSKGFYMFFEAIKGYDGKAVFCELR